MLSASQLVTATSDFVSLVDRYSELTLRFLDFSDDEVVSTEPINQDKLRAFTLLMHAEIENYLEIKVNESIEACKISWNKSGHLNPILLHMLIYNRHEYCGNANQSDPKGRINKIIGQALSSIGSNNGIKEQNLLKLYQQLGINILQNHPELSTLLESYGTIRGSIAHSNHLSIKKVLIKKVERKKLDDILDKLFILDAEVKSLLPIMFYQVKIP